MMLPRDIHLLIVSLLDPSETVRIIRRLSHYWNRITNDRSPWQQYMVETL